MIRKHIVIGAILLLYLGALIAHYLAWYLG